MHPFVVPLQPTELCWYHLRGGTLGDILGSSSSALEGAESLNIILHLENLKDVARGMGSWLGRHLGVLICLHFPHPSSHRASSLSPELSLSTLPFQPHH